MEYMFGAVAVGKAGASDQAVEKRIVVDNGKVGPIRDRLEERFRALVVHCTVRDEYRKHECYLETFEPDESDTEEPGTEEPGTEGSVKMEAVKMEAVKTEAAKMEAVKTEAAKMEAVETEAATTEAPEADRERPSKKRRYSSTGKSKEVDVLRWNRTFQKHPPGPISSFLSEGTPAAD